MKLKFGKGNAKLSVGISTFSLPAGWACPGAKECLSKAVTIGGRRKIKDGPHTLFRCFSASNEVMYPATYNSRQHNFKLLRSLKTTARMRDCILASLPKREKTRVHVSGDFYSQRYFDAWMAVARAMPDRIFYAYTKSLNYWVARLDKIPSNFVLTASYGGRYDNLIGLYRLRSAKVVFSEQEAKALGLEIDHDDSHAIYQGPSFALLIHGTQPKGSAAAKAKSALKGKGSYSKKKLVVVN